MVIVHIVDYLMPTMGYQEFLLPKWNSMQGITTYIVTSDRYFPVPNYNQTWRNSLGDRIIGSGKFIIEGVSVYRLNTLFEIKGRPWISGLRKTVKLINPDVIMVHGTGSISAYRMAHIAKSFRKPIIFDNHMIMDIIQKGLLQTIYYKVHSYLFSQYISQSAYKVIGVTEETCAYLEKIERIPAEKVYLLPLGVDVDIFNVLEKNMARFENNKKINIVQTGKLNNDKKPQWLALAVIGLLSQGFDVQLKYVGSGDFKIKSDIIELFEKAGFIDHLIFIDLVPLIELVEVFKHAHFTVFPEGTSLSALEAASCGSVVIMADHSASISRSKNGVGVVYKRGDIADLTRTIKYLLDNKDVYYQIQLTSKRSIINNYSYSKISKKFIDLCEKSIQDYNQKHEA